MRCCERNTTLRVPGVSLFRNFSDSCSDSEDDVAQSRARETSE